jgi:hypothetical protein
LRLVDDEWASVVRVYGEVQEEQDNAPSPRRKPLDADAVVAQVVEN